MALSARYSKATDTFDSEISASWENGGGDFAVMSWQSGGYISPSAASSTCAIRRTGTTFGGNQYSKVTLNAASYGSGWANIYAIVRLQGGTDESCYFAMLKAGNGEQAKYYLYEMTSAFGFSLLTSGGTSANSYSAGDYIVCEHDGTNVVMFTKEGAGSETQRLTWADSTVTGGSPGCGGDLSGTGTFTITAWDGGDDQAATGIPTLAGALVISGQVPAVKRDYTVSTGVGAITLTSTIPTVDVGAVPVNVPTFSGQLTISGQTPTVTRDFSVSTLAGSLVITGVAPTLTRDYTSGTLAGSLTISGQVPLIQTGSSPNIGTLTGQIVLTGVSPTLKRDYTIETLAGSLSISGQAPTLTRDYTVETLTGELVIAGYVPQALEGGSWNITPGSGQIVLAGYVPEVVNSGDPLPSKQTGGGKKRRRYQKPYVVEIDGEDFVVSTPSQAERLLEQAQEAAKELLVDVRLQTKDQPVRTPTAPRIRVKGPVGPDLTELVAMVSDTREAIRELYVLARNAEIGALMRKIAEDDEEDAITALLIH